MWRQRLLENYVSQVIEELVDSVCEVNNEAPIDTQIGQGNLPNNVTFEWNVVNNGPIISSKKFKRSAQKTTFSIKHNFGSFSDLFQIERNIDEIYDNFMKRQMKNANENDLISVGINHNELQKPIFIPPVTKKNFDKESFFNSMYEVSQSQQALLLDGLITLEVNITKSANGRGKFLAPRTQNDKEYKSKSVILINNFDKGCAFHAIVVCIQKYFDKEDKYLWQCFRRNTNNIRYIAACELAQKCNMSLENDVHISDFTNIQNTIPLYQLIVIDGSNKRNRLFIGKNYKLNKIYIRLSEHIDGNHFDSIINIKSYMGMDYYCEHCHTPYSKIHSHKCNYICNKCFTFPKCEVSNITIGCDLCNIEFNSQNCYNNHILGKNSVCKNVKKCSHCHAIYYKSHECDVKICKTCNEKYKLENHYCFMKTADLKKLNEQDEVNKIIVSYDIECQQNETAPNTYIHIPDLLICMTTCKYCWNEETNTRLIDPCVICGKLIKTFIGLKCIKEFGNYIYESLAPRASKEKTHIYLFAHNAKGYDNHFVINDLFSRKFLDISIIMNGNKILKASVGNIKFLDSLLMFQQPLASLPKAFGFESRVQKGYFPHMFHTRETMEYVGDIPEEKYFGIEYMKRPQLDAFKKWYDNEKIRINDSAEKYNLKSEMIKYCENDVLILLICIQEFRNIYKKVTSIDPITRCFTLASMGLEIFKTKILEKNTLGVTPVKGYGRRGSFSRIGNCWLDYQQKLFKCEIDREIPIDNYIVDGFIKNQNTILEYNGCYFHCHHCIYKDKRNENIIKKGESFTSPADVFKSTLLKKDHLSNKRGFNLIDEWDCTLVKKRKEDNFLNNYLNKRWSEYKLLDLYGGVSVREAFFGGRTNNIKFYCDVSNEENSRILYYDFRSLYPTVLKYKEFPIGHPKVLNEDMTLDISNYFGFVKCIVSPPKDLRIPILPLKNKHKKLIFPLCTKCSEILNPFSCKHNDEERALIGTWTTMELNYAIKRGYRITKVIEVYHYEEKTKDIFSQYINIWLQFKQQSDGWPTWCQTENDKKLYLENFLKNEGVQLIEKEVEKNPALRFIAKLFLNTLWGKFAQRPNLPQTKVCNEYHEYWDIATDPDKIIKGELMINDDCLLITWEHLEDSMGRTGNTSLAIASFVTSYARVELMKLIDEVEIIPGRLLYMDTDSIIFKYKTGDPKPETNDYLGCLADEISKDYGPDAVCNKFCSLGPKVYAIEINQPNNPFPIVPIKVKGITLTDKALDLIKMESMIKMANEYIKNNGDNGHVLKIPQMQIRGDKMHTIETKYFEKTFRVMSEKRRLNGNDTLPYGFVD